MVNEMSGLQDRPRRTSFYFTMAVIIVIASALAIKVVYLNTAESTYNAEELPLAPMALVSGSDAITDVAVTRLYGTVNITTTLSLEAFGFTTLGIKAPSMIFFFLAMVFIYLFSRRYFDGLEKWYALIPVALLCFGPPVMQIWGMKNRGGFIENIFALALCLWICASPRDGKLQSMQKLALAVTIGLATWSQPIGIIWGVVVIGYVLLKDLESAPLESPKTLLVIGCGLLLGLLPLIALNFMFRFNTINVLEQGEVPGGVDLGYAGRFLQVAVDGIPRLLGLKEQWSPAWIVPKPLAWLLYAVFMLPVLVASLKICIDVIRARSASLGLVLVGVGVAVVAANVVSSWGNFQLEPRRLLLLYVPLVLLIAYGLSRTPRLAIAYVAIWLGFNAWSNYLYISKNPHGFSNALYRPLHEVAGFLAAEGIQGIYTDVWTGGPLTFASRGTIPWYRSSYIPTSYGFVGDDEFVSSEAMLFNPHTPDGEVRYRKFMADLGQAGIQCGQRVVAGLKVVYKCSREFEFKDLPLMRKPVAAGEVVLARAAVDSDVGVIVGSKINGKIIANGNPGFLICGPYVPLPAGAYSVVVEGTSSGPFAIDIATDKGRSVIVQAELPGAKAPKSGILATQDFRLDQSATDLEVRISVPAGSDTVVERYRIIQR